LGKGGTELEPETYFFEEVGDNVRVLLDVTMVFVVEVLLLSPLLVSDVTFSGEATVEVIILMWS